MAHPPRSNPPLRSSSGPPRPCITPSTETFVVVVSFMSWAPSRWLGRRSIRPDRRADLIGLLYRGYDRPVDVGDRVDNPLERLELLAGTEQAIDSFLDELDVHGPREREMLRELGRA